MNESEIPARTAARLVHDELLMDGTPALNLASFVTTYMEEEAEKLMLENLSKNFIDVEEYPALGEIETRCVNMIARLFNAPLDKGSDALGVSTIGSSEAIILSVLAAKRRWQSETHLILHVSSAIILIYASLKMLGELLESRQNIRISS
jgi:glutamate decarboxylase